MAVTLIAWRQGVVVPARKITNKIPEFRFLTKPDVELLRVLLPTLLPFREWNVDMIADFSSRLDMTVSMMEPSVSTEIRQLFDLFQIRLVRAWLDLPNLNEATKEQMHAAIIKMQNSRLADLRAAALGLNELVCGIYYSNPLSDHEIGYATPQDQL